MATRGRRYRLLQEESRQPAAGSDDDVTDKSRMNKGGGLARASTGQEIARASPPAACCRRDQAGQPIEFMHGQFGIAFPAVSVGRRAEKMCILPKRVASNDAAAAPAGDAQSGPTLSVSANACHWSGLSGSIQTAPAAEVDVRRSLSRISISPSGLRSRMARRACIVTTLACGADETKDGLEDRALASILGRRLLARPGPPIHVLGVLRYEIDRAFDVSPRAMRIDASFRAAKVPRLRSAGSTA